MTEYIYIVKCPGCEDEMFNFFTDARMQCALMMSKKPIITQVEIERNDFGECTDSHDLGTVWSWEDAMKDTEGGYTEAEPTKSIFTKDDLKRIADGQDPEFDDDDSDFRFINEELLESRRISFNNIEDQKEFFTLCSETGMFTAADLDRFMKDRDANDGNLLDKLRDYKAELDSVEESCERKPIPEGMTIEELVEEMEENEDTVECTWCEELFGKDQCRYEVDLGWLCGRCEAAIKSRGETLTFRENNYWDFLDEDLQELSFSDMVADSINHLTNDLGKDPMSDDFTDLVIKDIEDNYDVDFPNNPEDYRAWASEIASEVSRQLNSQLDEDVKEIHDLGNEYDGGYPAEASEVLDSHLKLCPECGKETFDTETGICVDCGFN